MSDNHLTFNIPSGGENESPLSLLLHQAITDDDDQGENETNTGFVMWPSAVMLAHHITKNPSIVLGNDTRPDGNVMELGAGCGLTGLAAAALLQNDDSDNTDQVIFTDYNPAVLDNLRRNILLNDFDTSHEVFGLDWFDQQPIDENGEAVEKDENTWIDTEGASHAQCRLILVADCIVCSNDAELLATTINCALMEGGHAVVMGPGSGARFGIADFPEECRSLGLTVTVDEDVLEDNENDGSHQQLMDSLELGGSNRAAAKSAYGFTLFSIEKPITST
mmetsp:Transcript_13514/g.29377  ORF Transcript_13514/g.29377 Transcript_13514/m.29377 type:complete len:278 (-) Transcript_13514:50-883(-)